MDSVEAVGSRTPLGILTPSQQNSDAGDADFSKLTPSHFGISTDSFITFKEKDKSRVSQLKSRRRSTIGLRGSPETNSLIRFRATEVMKTPPRTPRQMLASPLFSSCDSIKQKMAAFQRLMGEDEEDVEQSATLTMEKKEERVGGGLADDAQAGSDAGSEERENRLTPGSQRPAVTPPPSKRRRRVPLGLCTEEIHEEPLSDLQNIPKQEVEFKIPTPGLGLGIDSQSQLMSLPMLSKPEVMRTDDPEVSSVSKKKRVRFGAPLSPEFFDKTLPPSTPLQKGATPLRPPSSTGRKQSLLKTPQRFEPLLPQPDFYSPQDNGASPEFRIPRSRREEDDGDKISFPVLEEESDPPADHDRDAVLAEEPDLALHPLSPTAGTECMDTAFQVEEDLLSSSTTDPSPTLIAEPEHSLEPQQNQEDQQRPESPATTVEASRPRGRKRKQQAERESEPEMKRSSRTAAADSRHKTKTKQNVPEKEDEDEPETRRSSRSAAASAKGKLKTATAKRRFGNKEVDRSLYGKRDYASKNPLLSPIIETAAASLTNTPTPPQPHPDVNSTPDSNSANQTTSIPNITSDDSNETAGLVAAAALFRRRFLQPPTTTANNPTNESTTTLVDDSSSQSEADVVSDDTMCQTGVALSGAKAPRARRNSGRPAGRRRSANSARGRRLSGSTQEHKSAELEEREEPASASGSSGSESSESSETLNVDRVATQHQPAQPESTTNEKAEDEPHPDLLEIKPSPEQTEDLKDSAEPSEPVLESWQEANFSIEDVLRPVKAKSRGSVRRSLRNRRSMDVQASGLAWVDHTSPELMAAGRRRTRGRLSAIYQPAIVLDTEEPQPQNLGE